MPRMGQDVCTIHQRQMIYYDDAKLIREEI